MISIERGVSQQYKYEFHKIFGDDYDFIDTVTDISNEIFKIFDKNIFCGGLCVFDVNLKANSGIKKGAYIYGAFICEEFRKRGFFKILCDHVCDFYKNKSYDFIFTIPANENLFSLYEKLGFTNLLNGTISLTNKKTDVFIPKNSTFKAFDNNFENLYFIHTQNDILIKSFEFFKESIADFDIKYIFNNSKSGYALYKSNDIIYASGDFITHSTQKKGLLKKFSNFIVPQNLLCDVLLEI